MEQLLIKPYELSVWGDELVQSTTNPGTYEFQEKKLIVIGSNTMTGQNKIFNPVFNKKANGERSLTFSLKYRYIDHYTGEETINPFATYLTNERKLKLHYDNEWYEFVIKDYTESSDEMTWNYSCTDAFVQELSKIGYNIEFNTELNNNQGTARDLAKETIKDTDWKIGTANVGRQYISEPLYKGKITASFSVKNTDTNQSTTFPAETPIYIFYSYIKNKDGHNVQFILQSDAENNADDMYVIHATNYRIEDEVVITEGQTPSTGNISFNGTIWITYTGIENTYHGNRLVYNQLTTYDPVMQRTVDRFKAGDRDIYRYIDYTYTTSNVITNFITNGDNFNVLDNGTLQGWNPYTDNNKVEKLEKLSLVTEPPLTNTDALTAIDSLKSIEGYLKVTFSGLRKTQNNKIYNTVYNSGFENNASIIGSVTKGEEFVFRFRAKNTSGTTSNLRCLVAKYTQDPVVRYGYYYRHINPSDVIIDFVTDGTHSLTVKNNLITGGHIDSSVEDGVTYYYYVIDDVVQEVSTRYVYVDDTYKATNDTTVVRGKSYYSRSGSQPYTYTKVTPASGANPKTSGWYTNEYVWNPTNKRFDPLSNSNYISYYYLTAKATKTITKEELNDVNANYGIFIYAVNNVGPYFIQDIQLNRCVRDGNGEPLLIGNIPTATSNQTEYYYLKPATTAKEEEVDTYTSLEDLKTAYYIQGAITPLYNEGSTKVLTINESQSNCFNILQTIAETFECWIELDVRHDDRGYILKDENDGTLQKYVNLKEYAGKDNWAGFKYGINLNTIERNLNSDEIVTKLIVDQAQCEYVEEGYVSIASAKANPSGESYILDFDYYYNQGLLNREEVERDKNAFFEELAIKNLQLADLEKVRRDLEASLTQLESKRTVFTELVDTAYDTNNRAQEEFEKAANMSYSDYVNRHLTLPEKDRLTNDETIYGLIGEIYVSSATINNYAGLLSNIESEYWDVRTKLRGLEDYHFKVWVDVDISNERHVFIEVNDYFDKLSFGINSRIYEVTVSTKYFDITTNDTNLTFNLSGNNYKIFDSTGEEVYSYNIIDSKVAKFRITSADSAKNIGVQNQINDIIEQKEELSKAFNNKYSRFILEGTWSSTDYVDSGLYYLDALQVSATSSQPKLSYTINVLEVSRLEGLENYEFDTGDKTYMEDTEFFGWTYIDGIKTPVKEEVIVSEVEWHLDEPDQNVITVQNYKTRFEDFFQRVSATVQTAQYNETTYAKISSILSQNGMINQDVLLKSLDSISGQSYALTSDGSIRIDGDCVLIHSKINAANKVKLSSEGLSVSNDGGATWSVAINGEGIQANLVHAGTINTDTIIIGNSNDPSFRWDKDGISAYSIKEVPINRAETETIYDLKTYVRFDRHGLYGIKDGENFKAQTLSEVLDEAHFAVTWDGFFIRNNYEGGGKVQITSDNDFQVINSNNTEKIKIGALEWIENGQVKTTPVPGVAPSLYGIRINNNDGQTVFKTGDDGNIAITGAINATSGNFSGVVNVGIDERGNTLGYLTDSNGSYITDNSGNAILVKKPTNDYIIIDGMQAVIKTSNYSDGAGYGWMINKDGDAVFNNITARGAIKTAVFEYAEIQAVGGVFLFRPSSIIKSARVDGTDLIVTVEKPQLFYKRIFKLSNDSTVVVSKTYYIKVEYGYEEVAQPSGSPKANEYYEIDSAISGSWCKISNYTSGEASVENLLNANGLTYVYEVTDITGNEITLENAAEMVDENTGVTTLAELVGGSLVDMGRVDGSTNYGIGINSSDNTVNLPARSISLFETQINPSQSIKVGYSYKGVFGTLPTLSTDLVNSIYNNYMKDTQGIFTNNMYIGDKNQYLAFYTDNLGEKHLKINTSEIILGYDDNDQPITIDDKISEAKSSAINIKIDSSQGNTFMGEITTVLTCRVYDGTTEITSTLSSSAFSWNVTDGVNPIDPSIGVANGNIFTITNATNINKIVANCVVTVTSV